METFVQDSLLEWKEEMLDCSHKDYEFDPLGDDKRILKLFQIHDLLITLGE